MVYTAILVVVGLLAGSIFALWKAHEEKKADDRRFEARMKANFGPVDRSMGPPRAAGTKHSRIA